MGRSGGIGETAEAPQRSSARGGAAWVRSERRVVMVASCLPLEMDLSTAKDSQQMIARLQGFCEGCTTRKWGFAVRGY